MECTGLLNTVHGGWRQKRKNWSSAISQSFLNGKKGRPPNLGKQADRDRVPDNQVVRGQGQDPGLVIPSLFCPNRRGLHRLNVSQQPQPHNRPHVSAQNAFLMLRDEVLDPPRNKEARIVTALDVKKAFDTISHNTILEGLEDIGCGRQVFRYVLSFLRDRKVTIGLGSTRSDIFAMPNRGTPQVSILSPLLFNVGVRRLALELEQVRDLGCTIYADDITLWAHRGSYGEKQDLLQEAINKVANFTKNAGMTCAPEKSEFITVRSKRCKKPVSKE
ncbi:hypothetical protein HPB50_016270 [Hyalomma asiaticum]|uniref:Uncharacterized protein n=1 Tax=Hyalomma asiaticum TaxID=266040 RepID=A0ACB7TA30_HYAAI|nr:hypothetical protein HPB50_016270 [Hyalomma asiaticum]